MLMVLAASDPFPLSIWWRLNVSGLTAARGHDPDMQQQSWFKQIEACQRT